MQCYFNSPPMGDTHVNQSNQEGHDPLRVMQLTNAFIKGVRTWQTAVSGSQESLCPLHWHRTHVPNPALDAAPPA